MKLRPFLTALAACGCAMLAASCSGGARDGGVAVEFFGNSGDLSATGLRLSYGAQQVRAATAEGLVTFDANGDIVPGLAERWIVTDDGQSYIFRLRNMEWPDGQKLSGQNTRDTLLRTISQLKGTSLGRDLAVVDEVRAMTGRVVEIRLRSPMPQFLRLLAQPELGLVRGRRGTGPMALAKQQQAGELALAVLPPDVRGEPAADDWQDDVHPVHVSAAAGRKAVDRFYDGEVDAVLGGRLVEYPLADTGPLSRGTVRLDPVIGLFGLMVQNDSGLMATARMREAVALAINRDSVMAPFNLGGWLPATQLVPTSLPERADQPQRWADLTFEQRQGQARRRVMEWQARRPNETARLTVYLPAGPGADMLFDRLEQDMDAVGITLVRAKAVAGAQLQLLDRPARYAEDRWFLNQLHCDVVPGPCAPDADALVDRALDTADPAARAGLLAEAAAQYDAANIFLPIGAPIRWSLVRGGVNGFAVNPWGVHPLFPMAQRPM